jgi:outer membrane protein assembly factor BamB
VVSTQWLVVAVGSDGRAYPLSQSNGALVGQPIPFVPASANVRSVNLFDYTLYATNLAGCGEDAVYALDLASDSKAVVKFTASRIHGSAGPAIGNDGTVYVHSGDRIIALTAKTLKEKDHLAIPAPVSTGMTPLVFQHNGKDIVVAGGGSEVYLLDSGALGGQDHSTPVARARVEGAVRAAFAGWEDPETRTRWIYVPVSSADPAAGGIAAFTIEERDGRLSLVPRWTARGMAAPAAPVVANGLVFALSTGGKSNAKLFVLDAAGGKEVFTSRDTVTGAANPDTGLAVANGQVYFSTQDNTVYCFGIPTEH